MMQQGRYLTCSVLQAPVKKTLKNRDIICENEEQRNQISEQEEAPRSIEMLEKPSDDVKDDEQTNNPSNREDQVEKASVEAEVKDQKYGEASQIDSKVKGLEYGEKRAPDVIEETMTGSKLSDSDNVPLSDHLQKTIKETLQIAGADERDPPAKNEESENKQKPRRSVEEQTTGEEEKDGDGEEDEEEEEHKITDSCSDDPVMVDASRDIDVKPSPKKSHKLLSGMGSKVKHSIAKVKKAITGKSSHHKQSSPK